MLGDAVHSRPSPCSTSRALEDGTHLHGVDLRIPGMPPVSVGYIQPPGRPVIETTSVRAEATLADTGLPLATTLTMLPGPVTATITVRGHAPDVLESETVNRRKAKPASQSQSGETGVTKQPARHQTALVREIMAAETAPLTTSILSISYFGDVVCAVSGALTAARYATHWPASWSTNSSKPPTTDTSPN